MADASGALSPPLLFPSDRLFLSYYFLCVSYCVVLVASPSELVALAGGLASAAGGEDVAVTGGVVVATVLVGSLEEISLLVEDGYAGAIGCAPVGETTGEP